MDLLILLIICIYIGVSQSLEVGANKNLFQATLDRQQADDENTKMKNRITMLAIEDQKMHKKMEDTRKKYEEIFRNKAANEEKFINKIRYRKQQEEDL